MPECPTRQGLALPMVVAWVEGEQNRPGGRKGQTPGNHRPPANMAAMNGVMGTVVHGGGGPAPAWPSLPSSGACLLYTSDAADDC